MPAKSSAASDNFVNFDSIQLTIDRAAFLRSLGRLQSIVEKRNTIPILSNIKIEAAGGNLNLTATDMDIAATEKVAAKITKEGAVTVPAHTLYDIVRKLPEGSEIELSLDAAKGNQLKVKSGNSKFQLSCLPAADFPTISEGQLTHNFSLSKSEFISLIKKTRFSISTEETRYYLNGVYLHISPGAENQSLRAVSTDGHRLARIEVPVPAGAAGMPGVIIPRKTVVEVKKIAEEGGETIQVSLSKTKIKFDSGNITLVSKLIDGTFPDYERVIPKENNKIMEVDSRLLTQAVDRVSTIATETRAIKFAMSGGKLTLSASSQDNGDATEEIPANYSSDAMDIGFNYRYVLEMMGELEGETAQFVFSDSTSPALVRDPADVTALYVIMPMRV